MKAGGELAKHREQAAKEAVLFRVSNKFSLLRTKVVET